MITTGKLEEAKILEKGGGLRQYRENLDDQGDQIVNPLELLSQLVVTYNGIRLPQGSTGRKQRIHLLDSMMVKCGLWLTRNPPSGSDTNKSRWEALADSVEQIADELRALEARMLSGPTDFEHITSEKRSYWLERLDTQHRPGWVLSEYYESWVQKPWGKGSFFEWVNNKHGGSSSVKYVRKYKLEKYEVRFAGNILVDSKGAPFDTKKLSTCWSGDGWAIFVCSLDDHKTYADSHIEGEFHHSSFLKGRPVLAAGELCVEKGKIRMMNAKSGHYQPTPANMQSYLQLSTAWGGAMIYPQFGTGVARVYPCRTFREEGLKASQIKRAAVLRALPKWAINDRTQRWINAVEA